MARTVPATRTFTLGETQTAAFFNSSIRDVGVFLATPPAFAAYQTNTQSIANATWTSVTFDVASIDTDTGFSAGSPSRYTCQVAGWYWMVGFVMFAGNATGSRRARIFLNGTTPLGIASSISGTSGDECSPMAGALFPLNVNDYIEIQGYQTSTAALSTTTTSAGACSLQMLWVAHL